MILNDFVSGKNLYNNEHVAIKLVSTESHTFISVFFFVKMQTWPDKSEIQGYGVVTFQHTRG